MRARHLWGLPPLAPDVLALRMDAELDFASASALERDVSDRLAVSAQVRHVCLFAQSINRIDVTGVETFARIEALVRFHGSTLHISGLKLPVEQVLLRAQVLRPDQPLKLYRSDAAAIQALQSPSPEKAGEMGALLQTQPPL